MAGGTQVALMGKLVEDPDLRFTVYGQAVASFRIAASPRFFYRQAGDWKDGDSLFLTCNIGGTTAEHVAVSLQRGMRVIVDGRLNRRSDETSEGESHTVYEVEVDEVGAEEPGNSGFRYL